MTTRLTICTVWLALGTVAAAAEPLIIAHRGASHDAPENTVAAFRLAMEQGADGFEGDYYLTSDGQIACIHDPDTERVAGEKLLVKQSTLAELRQLDVGAWKHARYRGERLPTLEESLDEVPPGKLIYIELKTGPEIVKPMLAALDASSLQPEQTVVIAFNADTIAEVERLRPELRTYWLVRYKQDDAGRWTPTVDEVIATLKRIKTDGLDSQAEMKVVDRQFVDKLRASGPFDFQVWTVDDPKVARFYTKLGATGITTNRPGWLRRQLDAKKPAPATKIPAAAGR